MMRPFPSSVPAAFTWDLVILDGLFFHQRRLGWLQRVLERQEHFPQPWEPLDPVQELLVPRKKYRNEVEKGVSSQVKAPRPSAFPSTHLGLVLELALKDGARMTPFQRL